jgi:CRISPR-associated endoribonuclease Cas6
MRIFLQLSKGNQTIPFNYQSHLTGAIHKWIGEENEVHDNVSLYSFSWLQNIDTFKDGIKTKKGSYFFISAFNEVLIKKIVKGVRKDPCVCFGVTVTEVEVLMDPNFSNKESFFTASPIFIKRRFENHEKHISFNDPDADTYLTETLRKKLRLAGIPEEGVRVSFDRNYHNSRTKVISYKTIGNKVNICPVMIEGSSAQIAFAWNVGVGNSTGIGFGALK